MELLDYLKKEFKYDAWANQECLNSLKAAGTPPQSALKLIAHILGAEYLWLRRVTKETNPTAVWPAWSIEECEKECNAISSAWSSYLDSLTLENLNQSVSYVNSKGEQWISTVQDILTHVVLHSSYHRGQIASDMRQNDCTPAYTDFIHATRNNLVE